MSGLLEAWAPFCADPWAPFWDMVADHPYVLAAVVWYPRASGDWVGVAYRVTDMAVLGYRTEDGTEAWHDRPRLMGEPGGHPLPRPQLRVVR